MRRFPIYFGDDLYEQLEAKARERGVTITQLIRDLLIAALGEQSTTEKPVREMVKEIHQKIVG